MKAEMNTLLKLLIQKGGSDLHITCGCPPQIRIDEKLIPTQYDKITPETAKELAHSILNKKQIELFEKNRELDMSFGIRDLSRFRVNVYQQRGSMGIALRAIPFKIMNFEECGVPVDVVTNLCNKPKGLVLVTGSTGSGKSTSLASMIDYISQRRQCHIVTIEDPIEFLHEHKKAIIEQREIGNDTYTFGAALKHVLRQDPDVILIGEMRDLETIESALIIAETGHLVFATLHTSDCVQTINRIVDVFPAYQQAQIRTQLSFVLLGILSQQLIPRAKGVGRVLAVEILVLTPAVRSMIREAKTHQIGSVIQTGQRDGMKTMNQALAELYQRRSITYEDAISRTTDAVDLSRLMHK
ncbi:MAG: PilT/PilU family type 4a pilus ATPase [Candidatus Omnitrophica bacterium]|nr:PilT/PilU family type 4a pilus ATPase [Candidatus Omnitrophota bacterium]